MNKHILLLIKWLDDKNSVSPQELIHNSQSVYDGDYNDAYLDYAVQAAAAYAAYAGAADDAAAYAAYGSDAKLCVDAYLEDAGENKEDYIMQILNNNGE